MERLNFENLVFVRIKKNFLNFLLYLGQESFWNWIHPIDTSNSEFSKIFDKHWVYLQKSFANFWSSSTATHTWKELFRANLQNEKKWKMNMNSFATLAILAAFSFNCALQFDLQNLCFSIFACAAGGMKWWIQCNYFESFPEIFHSSFKMHLKQPLKIK